MRDYNKAFAAIDFNSYTSSSGWLGYTTLASGSRSQASLLLSEAAEVEGVFESGIVLTNAHTFESPERFCEQFEVDKADFTAFIEPLFNSKLLNVFENYTLVSDVAPLDGVSAANQKRLCIVYMNIDGVYGHCFFYRQDIDVLLYPHEDVGLGVIALSDDGKIAGDALLRKLSEISQGEIRFELHLRSLSR